MGVLERVAFVDFFSSTFIAQKNAFEIAADMTRQYKAMREKLLEKIDQLEVKLTVYLDKLDMAKLAKEDMIREHERQIAEKDQEIANREAKMDEMAQEFSNMLKVSRVCDSFRGKLFGLVYLNSNSRPWTRWLRRLSSRTIGMAYAYLRLPTFVLSQPPQLVHFYCTNGRFLQGR